MSKFSDDELLDVLGKALRAADPLPEHVRDSAVAAHTWHSIDQELLELTSDQPLVGAGMRGDGDEGRFLTMEANGLALELQIGAGPNMRVVGQIVPASEAVVSTVRSSGETVDVEADDLGRFVFSLVEPGSVRFRVQLTSGASFDTEWITI